MIFRQRLLLLTMPPTTINNYYKLNFYDDYLHRLLLLKSHALFMLLLGHLILCCGAWQVFHYGYVPFCVERKITKSMVVIIIIPLLYLYSMDFHK